MQAIFSKIVLCWRCWGQFKLFKNVYVW